MSPDLAKGKRGCGVGAAAAAAAAVVVGAAAAAVGVEVFRRVAKKSLITETALYQRKKKPDG